MSKSKESLGDYETFSSIQRQNDLYVLDPLLSFCTIEQ